MVINLHMTVTQPNSNLDNTIPEDERYPMMRSLVNDLERYINPETNTPSRHERASKTRRFYVIDDNVYVGESLCNELAARRNSPLLLLDDSATYPDDIYGNSDGSCSFLDFLAESQHREVVVCIADITTLPPDIFDAITEILRTGEFDPTADVHQAPLDNPDEFDHITGSWDNLIFLASEPSDTFLDDCCAEIKEQFGVQVDPETHDGYTDSAFDRLN